MYTEPNAERVKVQLSENICKKKKNIYIYIYIYLHTKVHVHTLIVCRADLKAPLLNNYTKAKYLNVLM